MNETKDNVVTRVTLKDRLSRDEFIALHHNQRMSQKAIAEKFSISIAYVIRLRKQYGIPVNLATQKKLSVSNKKPPLSLEHQTTPEEIKRLYMDELLSCDGIALHYGVSRKTVWKYIQRHGLPIRDKTKARRNAIASGRISQVLYDVNENFFSDWSSAMAWVLGLMVTDGNIAVGPSGILVPSLSSISAPLLEKVRLAMDSNLPIKLVNQTLGGTIFRLTLCRRKLAEDLSHLGVKPKKSLTIPFPDVPRQFLPHFIRGVFDGDGSVFFDPRSPKATIRVFFISGSWDFVTGLENALHTTGGLSKQTIYRSANGRSFSFKYGHTDALRFFDFVYAGAGEALRFEVKYQKFVQGMKAAGMLDSAIAMRILSLEAIASPSPQPVQNFSLLKSEITLPKAYKDVAVLRTVKKIRHRFTVKAENSIVYAGWIVSQPGMIGGRILCTRSSLIPYGDLRVVEEGVRNGQTEVTVGGRTFLIETRKRDRQVHYTPEPTLHP